MVLWHASRILDGCVFSRKIISFRNGKWGWMYYKGGEIDDRFYLEREEDIVIVHLTIANEVL